VEHSEGRLLGTTYQMHIKKLNDSVHVTILRQGITKLFGFRQKTLEIYSGNFQKYLFLNDFSFCNTSLNSQGLWQIIYTLNLLCGSVL